MNLYHLRYFSVLAKTENYTQAANLLNITQPSLSNAIHSLEKEIHVKLFAKKGRRVQLTEPGRQFAQDIDRVLIQLDRSVSTLQASQEPSNLIQVAALRTLSTRWLPNMVRQFLKARPDITSQFKFSNDTGLSPDIIERLREEKYDVAFCSKIDQTADVTYTPIAEQELVVITPLNHPLANRTELNLAETLPYPQITFSPRSGLYPVIHHLFAECGGQPISAYAIEEDQAVAGMVANNFGIAVVPNMDGLNGLPVKIIPLTFPKWHRFLYMATLKQHYQNPAAKAFIEFIQKSSKKVG